MLGSCEFVCIKVWCEVSTLRIVWIHLYILDLYWFYTTAHEVAGDHWTEPLYVSYGMMEHGRVLHHDSKADLSSGACATDGSGTADHGNVSAGLVCTQNNARLLDHQCHTHVSHLWLVDTGQADQLTKAGTEGRMAGDNASKSWVSPPSYKYSLVTIVNCSLFYIRYKQKMDSWSL